jgi:hypothetical protein
MKDWRKEFARIHYEPEHETGPIAMTCWCKPKSYVVDGTLNIDHIPNRDVCIEFIEKLLRDV